MRFLAPTAASRASVFGEGPAWFDTLRPAPGRCGRGVGGKGGEGGGSRGGGLGGFGETGDWGLLGVGVWGRGGVGVWGVLGRPNLAKGKPAAVSRFTTLLYPHL